MGHWFKHDSDASEDEKLLTLKAIYGKAGLCDWWTLCEILSSKEDAKYPKKYLLGLTKKLELTPEQLDEFIKTLLSLDLLVEEDGFIFSRSMVVRLEEYEATKERNRLKKQGQRKDKEGTSRGQDSEVSGDTSLSLSISNSRSLDLNKKEESAEAPLVRQGRRKYHDWVYLSDDEYSQAKSFYSQNGLEEKYFEFAIRELDRRLDKKPELRGLNHKKELQATWLIGLVTDQKQKDTKLQKTKDPPKSFKDLQAEREHEERNALREKYKKEDEERERLELLEEQENEKKQNEKTRVDGLLTRTLSQLPKLQAH